MGEEKAEGGDRDIKTPEMNYRYSLPVLVGSDLSGDNTVCGDESVEEFIGSDINPVRIAEENEPYEGNSFSTATEYWIITQKGEAMLIQVTIVESAYGYRTQEVAYSWQAFGLPGVTKKNMVVSE